MELLELEFSLGALLIWYLARRFVLGFSTFRYRYPGTQYTA